MSIDHQVLRRVDHDADMARNGLRTVGTGKNTRSPTSPRNKVALSGPGCDPEASAQACTPFMSLLPSAVGARMRGQIGVAASARRMAW